MGKRNRLHTVPQGPKKNPNHVGTITQEDFRQMDRAARRQAEIDGGLNRASGTGVHGGGKRERNRRERRENKVQSRHWDRD